MVARELRGSMALICAVAMVSGCSGGADKPANQVQTQTTTKTETKTEAVDPKMALTPAKLSSQPRKDPFLVSWKDNTRPPDNVFDNVSPIRVTPTVVEEPPAEPTEVRETTTRRYAGFMNGDGVYAVLEEGSDSEIVKPGELTRDGFKVVSITNDQVFLRKQEGNLIRTQLLPYGDLPPTAATGGGGRFGGGGGAQQPGRRQNNGPGGNGKGGGME